MPLSQKQVEVLIKASEGSNKQIRHRDSAGLYLMTRNGFGSWVISFWRDGKSCSEGLGSTKYITPQQARLERDERNIERRRQDLLAASSKPWSSKAPDLSALASAAPAMPQRETFQAAYLAHLTLHANRWADGGARFLSLLNRHCGSMAGMPLTSVTRQDVAQTLAPIWIGAKGNGFKLKQVMTEVFAARLPDGASNPCEWSRLKGLLPAPSQEKKQIVHRDSIPWLDASAFYAELGADAVARCLKWIMLTACRANEAAGARWEEIEGETWKVPGNRTKSGRDHIVPLTPTMVSLLGRRKQTGLIFEVENTASGQVNAGTLLRLAKQIRPDVPVSVHGFRATFRTWCQDNGMDHDAAELCLAHKETDDTLAAYKRSALMQKRRDIMSGWSTFCGG